MANRAKRFSLDGLPAEIRVSVIQARESSYIKGLILPSRADLDLGQARALLEMFDNAPAWSRRKAEARGEIVDAFARFSSGMGLTEAKKLFVNRYNAGNDHLGIPEETYGLYETISRPSLDLWRSRKKDLGLAGLLESTRRGKPKGRITQEMAEYIVGIKRNRIHTRPARIYDYLMNKFGGTEVELPHQSTVRRFVSSWETKNTELVAFLKNPDRWRSHYQAAFGDAAEKALHFLHMVEFDNTPADVMCADGKRYTLTGAIDIFSRKAKCLVVPTSKSVAVANLMRWIILEWGLFDVMISDNGKDYASKHIEAACGALGIELPDVPPFTPEAKPFIERFFRSISMMLFEELSGYIGHSVAERRAIESRKSFAQRMFKKGETIECRMMPEELQGVIDTWTERVYHQRTHGELKKSPEARAGESTQAVRRILDERILDILLAPEGKPTVSKKGIRYRNGHYVAPELADWIKQRVQIRRDLADAGKLYVFDLESRFICIAQDACLEGISVEEAVQARKHQAKRIREQARALQTLADEVGDPMMDLLEAKGRERGRVMAFRREEAFTSSAIEEASKAVQEPDDGTTFTAEPAELENLKSQISNLKSEKVVVLREEPIFENRLERYKYLQKQTKIRTLTDKETGFIEGYEGSEEYYRIFVMPYE